MIWEIPPKPWVEFPQAQGLKKMWSGKINTFSKLFINLGFDSL